MTYMPAAVAFIILLNNRSPGVVLLKMATACDTAGSAGEKWKVWKAFGDTVGCWLVACWCGVGKCIRDLADLAAPMLVRMSGNILLVIKAIKMRCWTVPPCRDWFPPPVFRSQRGRRNSLFLRGDNSLQGRFCSQWSDEFSNGFWLQMNHTTLPNSMSLLLYLHKELRLLMDCQWALEWKLSDWLCIIWVNTLPSVDEHFFHRFKRQPLFSSVFYLCNAHGTLIKVQPGPPPRSVVIWNAAWDGMKWRTQSSDELLGK